MDTHIMLPTVLRYARRMRLAYSRYRIKSRIRRDDTQDETSYLARSSFNTRDLIANGAYTETTRETQRIRQF